MASQVWSDCPAFFLFDCANSLFLALPHEAFLNRKDKSQVTRQHRKYFGCKIFGTSWTCDFHSLSVCIFLRRKMVCQIQSSRVREAWALIQCSQTLFVDDEYSLQTFCILLSLHKFRKTRSFLKKSIYHFPNKSLLLPTAVWHLLL